MSWRTIVVQNLSKLSFKNGYLVVRQDKTETIHLSEIGVLMLESTAITITVHLLAELTRNKINVIFCDEKRNPSSQLVPFYSSHNTPETIGLQMDWTEEKKGILWQNIVIEKIIKQSEVLSRIGFTGASKKMLTYSSEVQPNDSTNREAIAAKLYFSTLFGNSFVRSDTNSTNAALNYGYTLLLSSFNREITVKGYLSQIGVHHKNRFNHYNLSSDLMETYRPLIDEYVYKNIEKPFDSEYKKELVKLLDSRVEIRNTKQYLYNALTIYVSSIMNSMKDESDILVYHYSLLQE